MIKIYTETEKVSIYRNGAEVLRKGVAELEEGTQTLQICGLSSTASTDTARLFAAESLSCSNMRFFTPGRDDEDSEYKKLQEQIALINKKIEAKKLQLQLWKSNGDFSSRTSQSAPELEAYIEKLGDRILGLEEDITALLKERRGLEKQAEELSEQEIRPVMSVDVTAEMAGKYGFELRYFENSANWMPVYEVHSDAENPVEIKLRAKIFQYTPEDWKDVKISLFTGNPTSTGSLPKLDPVFLDIREPKVYAQKRNAMNFSSGAMMGAAKMAAPMAMMDTAVEDGAVEEAAIEAPKARMATRQAEVNSDDTMTEYSLPGTLNIPKNEDGVMADLQNFVIPAEYRIAAAPALDLNAYLTARIKSADLPMISAVTAGIYLKGMYTGDMRLDPDLTDEYVNITLGREERVKISHKELARKTSTTLLKGQKVVEYNFETKVSNLTGEEIKVHLEDQIPVSQNKDITVDAVDLSGAKPDAETGLLSWDLTVAPAASETLKLGYKVSRPKDKEVEERRKSGRKFCPYCGSEVFGRFCPECGREC